MLTLQRNALRYRVCLSWVNYGNQTSRAYPVRSPQVIPGKALSAINGGADHKMHKMTTLYWMEPEQLSCISGPLKPLFNTTFTVAGLGLSLHSSGSKCSCQKEFLGDQSMLSLEKASTSAKHRSIISTTYKKSKGFIMREENHHRLREIQMVSLPCTFISQQNQARSQLVKTGKFPLACGSLTLKKGQFQNQFCV